MGIFVLAGRNEGTWRMAGNWALGLVLLAIGAGPAFADQTYKCDAAKDWAKVAVPDKDTVGTTINGATCTFSVNKAQATASTTELSFVDAANALANLAQVSTEALPAVVEGLLQLDPAQIDKFRSVTAAVAKASLASCLEDVMFGKQANFSSGGFICEVLNPESEAVSSTLAPQISVQGPESVLELGVILDGATIVRFIPVSLIRPNTKIFEF